MPILYETYAYPRRLVARLIQPRRVSFSPIVDETTSFKVIAVGAPKASIYGIRARDNIKGVWYAVAPEGKQAYCTPGAAALHVVFGGMNVGDVDGNIFGKLTDDKGAVIIPETKQWCAVGKFVWWEKTIEMPGRDYALKIDVGH